jgi:hypothetical protein
MTRVIFYLTGIRFEDISLYHYWQFLDVELLKNRLLESLFYLHSQPPLFNLFLGVVLKLFPQNTHIAFIVVYLALGLTLSVSVFILLLDFGVPRKTGLIVTLLFVIYPSAILYENWLFYTYPATTFLTLSAIFLIRFIKTRKTTYGVLFFTLLSFLVLIRASFHFLWFALYIALPFIYIKDLRKKILLTSLIPLIAVLFIYGKNYFIFGEFNTSSWLGMNLSRMTTDTLAPRGKIRLFENKAISKISTFSPWSPLEKYKPFIKNPGKTGIPALDDEYKSKGAPNLNNIAYIDISRQYMKDSISIIANYPKIYLGGLKRSYSLYFFRPSSEYFVFNQKENRKQIRAFEDLYYIILLGKVPESKINKLPPNMYVRFIFGNGLFLLLWIPTIAVYCLYLLYKGLLRRFSDPAFELTIIFMFTTIFYLTLVGNLFEHGENNRFRFVIEPFMIIITVLLIDDSLRWLRRKYNTLINT